ncbi:GreA/GreB family elongation factor [Streptomyces sp. V3I7]|uniref:GreA/GreB family elongation factor n=1 Tax=Streptomyces sp. V3I7 TaxID=3042278 RepID=UPI0027843F33|nr:GreA/GreB family elongation factor [Streptomyces sp. V3I7]MDQ0988943.1 transcription elongation factor GreA [Streptomyces sp. V3I7]
MTTDPGPIGADARRALERELADLRTERDAVAKTLKDTDEPGTRADQADELERATELGRLDQRISEVTVRLQGADRSGPPPTDVVGMGSTVTVRFFDGTQSTIEIGEIAEASDPDLVTADSPLGRALLGRRAGETVSYTTPEGQSTAVVVSLGDGDGDGDGKG